MDDITTIAHQAAYEKCGILYCDISPLNILISEENDSGGLLIDWDLYKDTNVYKHTARRAAHIVRIECLLICTAVIINQKLGYLAIHGC